VLGGLVAGWIGARRHPLEHETWRAGAAAAALGLAVWSVLGPVRGGVAGIAAPPPLGWLLPGEPVSRVPVFLLEAAVYGGFAWWMARGRPTAVAEEPGPASHRSPRHPGGLLAATVALVHVGAGLLRPSPPPLDEMVDVLAGLLAVVAAAAVASGRLRRVPRTVVAAVVLLAALVALPVALGPPETRPATPAADGDRLRFEVDDAWSPWGLEDLQAFVAEGDGRPVVVNFWASWCPPCHAEAPALARAARALASDAVFVGVLVDDNVESAREFEARYDLPFPTVVDGGVWRSLAGAGLPTTVVLRGDGTVASTLIGGVDGRRLAAAVDGAGR
jgi:thiol-disulfide isomerase/thioredoxin